MGVKVIKERKESGESSSNLMEVPEVKPSKLLVDRLKKINE